MRVSINNVVLHGLDAHSPSSITCSFALSFLSLLRGCYQLVQEHLHKIFVYICFIETMLQMLKIIELSNYFLDQGIKLFYIGSKLPNCFVLRIPG